MNCILCSTLLRKLLLNLEATSSHAVLAFYLDPCNINRCYSYQVRIYVETTGPVELSVLPITHAHGPSLALSIDPLSGQVLVSLKPYERNMHIKSGHTKLKSFEESAY